MNEYFYEQFSKAKFFIKGAQRKVSFFYEKRIGDGWNGIHIEFKYLNSIGYHLEARPFGQSDGFTERDFNSKEVTTDKDEAMKWLGNCHECKRPLYDPFTNSFHDIPNCTKQIKKAISNSTES